MAEEIVWSVEAQRSLDELYDFLEATWPDKVIIDFTEKLERKLELIHQSPTLYKASIRLEGTRECIVTEHNTIFYKYSEAENIIYIVSFWSNFKNPDDLYKPETE
jgi:plasmid stabilization system protein ParE